MVEKCEGGVDTSSNDRGCDSFLLVPGDCLTDVLTVIHRDFQEVVEKSSDQNFTIIQFSVTVTRCIEAKVIVDFEIKQH